MSIGKQLDSFVHCGSCSLEKLESSTDIFQKCEDSWMVLRFIKCLGVNGIAAALNVDKKPRFSIKVGVITLSSDVASNTSFLAKHIKQLNAWELNSASSDWIIASKSINDIRYIHKVLNSSELRYDQNIIVVLPENLHKENKTLREDSFKFKSQANPANCSQKQNTSRICIELDNGISYYQSSNRYMNIAKIKKIIRNGHLEPLYRGGIIFNYTRKFHMSNASELTLNDVYKKNNTVHVLQYFKVRVNSTLYASYLGYWDLEHSMANVKTPYPVEARNFMGEKLIVGRCNYTDEKSVRDGDGPTAPGLLDDLLYFIIVRMNGTSLTRYYSKLGFRTYEGAWSGLLGALLDHTVDIAFEPVTEQARRADESQQEMDFIFPIADTMYSIYVRNQETSSVRDIFLAPFSNRLLICVAIVLVLSAIAVFIITNKSRTFLKKKPRKIGCTEALMWSTGIFCQQGATWTPSNPASSILVIVCLFFGLVTYNAYAAFITSVLSVRVANMGSVSDVLQYPNMKIGYIKNGADQIYLMSTKDVQLNAFYIRGYSEAENLVSSTEEGLARAASQDYAFFAGQRSARSTLKSMSQARGRCVLRDLPVHSTRSQLSFPLPRLSPYSRPILISFLRLRSGGTLSRLSISLVPAMPQCASPSGFASARAHDVQTAFLVIVAGLIASLFVVLGEYCWRNREGKWLALKKYWKRIIYN